ncbi:MAG: YqgE/AlgH family protein [Bacteroidetes bacterium]|nr:YqgE/AlgH family protein [Bacteroidota bacterium]
MESFDLNFKNNEKVKKGSLLISDPFLADRYFGRSVVLICGYGKEGAFGFVLNHYLDVDLHKLDEQFPDIQARISLGGPVDKEHLFFIHTLGNRIDGSTSLYNGIFYGGDFEQLNRLFETEPNTSGKVRFFIGYSGWSEGQLEQEIKESSWLPVNNITTEIIMDTKIDKLWETCLEKQGKRFKIISKFPRNPEDN